MFLHTIFARGDLRRRNFTELISYADDAGLNLTEPSMLDEDLQFE